MFQIGSITKSFIAIVLLQLREEGKLDLEKPILDYLPWLRIQSAFPPITTHHLLTHSSGLSAAWEVFLSDPSQRHIAAYAPGKQFYYNNLAYAVLGHLAWTLDGRELPDFFASGSSSRWVCHAANPSSTSTCGNAWQAITHRS